VNATPRPLYQPVPTVGVTLISPPDCVLLFGIFVIVFISNSDAVSWSRRHKLSLAHTAPLQGLVPPSHGALHALLPS
jgi:hypothetical protein